MRLISMALLCMPCGVAAAQQQVMVGPTPMVVGQSQAGMLLTGTTVPLRTVTELTTKDKRLKVGDRFNLEVSEAVTLNGVTVIPVGSTAVGEVTTVRNKGMFGKSGLIETRLLYVRANNRQIRISGRVEDKGSKNGVGAGVATYATLVGGFLVTGTSAVIPAGTSVQAYLDEDMPVVFAPGVSSVNPMVVPPAK
jgi:hypothetical protein